MPPHCDSLDGPVVVAAIATMIGDGQFVERRPVGVFGCFGVGGLGELFLQSTVIAYWFKVVLAMMWKPVTTSGSMATTVSA